MQRHKVITVTGAFIIILCSGGIWLTHSADVERRTRGMFTVTQEAVTIMSAPIPVLTPHTHEVSDTRIDTVNSPGHGVNVNSGTFIIPFDMWVTDITTVVNNAPTSVIHHIVLFRQDRMDPICPNRHEQLMVVGADTATELNLPKPYGFFLKKGTRIYLRNMAHNPDAPRGSGETYRNVSLGLKLTYERASQSDRTQPVALYRIFIDDHPEYCSGPLTDLSLITDSFTVPPSSLSYVRSTPSGNRGATGRFIFPTPGTLVYIGAHTHPADGGGTVRLQLNSKVIGSFTPQHIGPEAWTWRTPNARTDIAISKGDVMTVQSEYNNPHPLPVPGAMGMGVFVFAPQNPDSLLK